MPDIDKLKNQQEKVKTEIRQLENRQKILLNRKTDAERKARTRRLIEHGAILESIFPATTTMTGEEIKAFLSAISRLPEVMRLLKNEPESKVCSNLRNPTAHLYTVPVRAQSRAGVTCRGRGVLWTQWGATLPNPLVCSAGKDTRSASALSSEADYSSRKEANNHSHLPYARSDYQAQQGQVCRRRCRLPERNENDQRMGRAYP